jgi:hypothetical protein
MKQVWIHLLSVAGLIGSVLLSPAVGLAQDSLLVDVSHETVCDTVTFSLNVDGGSGTYDVTFDYGDGEASLDTAFAFPLILDHAYPASGTYGWAAEVIDTNGSGLSGMAQGEVLVGPTVALSSDPFPPLVTLSEGSGEVLFTAEASGGQPPYAYSWDLNGDGVEDPGSNPSSSSASFTYSEPGKFGARVTVTDDCGLDAEDTLSVVVFDPEDACHPRAEQIAEAVSSLFPNQAQDVYSCDDIFGFFNGALTGSQLGFGRMWHAYKLSLTLEELTWEEILDWHLEGSGWGHLTQLDRFADAIADQGIRELMGMILSGEASVNDIRSAVRAVTRYEADFEDALARVQAGMSPGKLGQFYNLAQDLGMDPGSLDVYLEDGMDLSELSHAARLAERHGTDLDLVADAKGSGSSWGEIGQAFRLADEEYSAQQILDMGVKTFREQDRDQQRSEREAEQQEREVRRLAEQYGASEEDVAALFGTCEGDQKCVRDQLRADTAGTTGTAGASQEDPKSDRNAAQIASKYGVSTDQVWGVFNGSCSGDWSCVRAYFREQSK